MNLNMSRRSKRLSAVVATVAVIAGGGAAFAWWSSSGAGGTTGGTTGTNTPFTFTQGTITGDALTPGGPGQLITFTVNNPGTGSQMLVDTTVAVANPDGTSWTHAGGCNSADYTVVMTAEPAPGQIAGLGNAAGSVTLSLNNNNEDQNNCKGLTSVPLYFTAV